MKKSFSKSAIVVLVLVAAIALLIYYNNQITPPLTKKQPKWVSISYADLLDFGAIIRTGQELRSALGNPQMKGAVQPFVDQYSFLLQHSFEMLSGPDKLPHSSVTETYPAGSAQPAWVAIFRGGRIHITADNKNHARVFLLGDDPEKAYQANYSVIRHCLNALVPSDGSALNLDVFAYTNDYPTSQLRLNMNPYAISTTSFPPKNVVPLDLAGLATFFKEAPEIQGARLDRSSGLMLYGKQVTNQTLAGTNLSLSDFVVAYRAVFHAGDNQAFISLDPHSDPTKVTVNFGGFLEDTRVGSVVLESDKRFKTITSGLDPNTMTDLRKFTRQHVPSFLSVAEQHLLDSSFMSHGKWMGTRFWFYPDSIGIESDLNYQYALVTNPQFMADAERSREDFASPAEFEKKKSATLSPAIRRNIDHLNQNYTQYANAFGELRELTTVARLMGICTWLYKADPRWLDLDALLSVELPPVSTSREKTQLVAACVVGYPKSEEINSEYVIRNASVLYLSPVLDKAVSEHFGNSTNFAKYLSLKNRNEEDKYRSYETEAAQIFNTQRNRKVREIIKSKKDLEALASYSAHTLEIQEPPAAKALEKNMSSDKEAMEKLKTKIDQIERLITKAEAISAHNALVSQYSGLVSQYESIRYRFNQKVGRYNALEVTSPLIIEIGGGINLEPRNFRIKTSQTSPKLMEFRGILDMIGTEWRSLNGSGKWIRNSITADGSELKNKLPKFEWTLTKETISDRSTYRHIQADSSHQSWSALEAQSGSWRDCRRSDRDVYQERAYAADSKKLQIVEFRSGKIDKVLVGQMDDSGRIVFRKSERQDIMKPQEPPVWFSAD